MESLMVVNWRRRRGREVVVQLCVRVCVSWFHTLGWNWPRAIQPQREKAKKRTAPQRMNLTSSGKARASVRVRAYNKRRAML